MEQPFDNQLLEYGNTKNKCGFTWQDIADNINATYCTDDCKHSESYYRKRYKKLLDLSYSNYKEDVTCAYDKSECDSELSSSDNYSSSSVDKVSNETTKHKDNLSYYENLLNSIKIERVKLSDERIQNNAYIRTIARQDNLVEIIKDAVQNINTIKPLNIQTNVNKSGENGAVLILSDWHYGLECHNVNNMYNTDIARNRIENLCKSVIDKCLGQHVSHLVVLNLSDLICGRIHLPLRLDSRYDTVTQTMHVAEILSDLLNTLSRYFKVDYYDCEDNHSRLEPNKKDSIHLENFTRIITWYLKTRLNGNNNIKINDKNEYGDDIITFKCNGYSCAAVHGDKDPVKNIVNNLSSITNKQFDLIATAHMHHFYLEEINNTIVVQNGTLMGTDYYAHSIRKCSKPSQTLIIMSTNNPVECLYRILL